MRTLSNIERGAQPRVQYYQCSRGLVLGMGTDIILQPVCRQMALLLQGNIDICYPCVNGQVVHSVSPAEVDVPVVVTAEPDELTQQEGDAGVQLLCHLRNTIYNLLYTICIVHFTLPRQTLPPR